MPARSPLLDRTNLSDSSVSSGSDKGINIDDILEGVQDEYSISESVADAIGGVLASLITERPPPEVAAEHVGVILARLFDNKADYRKFIAKLETVFDLLPPATVNANNGASITPMVTANPTVTHLSIKTVPKEISLLLR